VPPVGRNVLTPEKQQFALPVADDFEVPDSCARRKVALDHRDRIDRSQSLGEFFRAVPPQSCFVIAPGVVCEPTVPLGYKKFKVASIQESPLNQSHVSRRLARDVMLLRQKTTAVTNGPVRTDLGPTEETTAAARLKTVAIIGDLAASILTARTCRTFHSGPEWIGTNLRKFVRVDRRKEFEITDILNPHVGKRYAVMGQVVIEPVEIRIREPHAKRREDHGQHLRVGWQIR